MLVCWSPLFAGKKNKQSKKLSKAKSSSKRNHRVKPVDVISITSTENGLNEKEAAAVAAAVVSSSSFSAVEKASMNESLASAEPTGDAADKKLSSTSRAPPNLQPEPGQKFDENKSQLVPSSLDRVKAWVDCLDVEDRSFSHAEVEDHCDHEMQEDQTLSLRKHLEMGESTIKKCSHSHTVRYKSEESGGQASNIIQSLNSFSAEAHFSSIGLKAVPSIAAFTTLRSVNLSGNGIVNINPGSLPKSLHTLDLSLNKISTVDGLKGLERLRVLNLSYNRISRIGHGFTSCILIKELYLAGNKISDVEGLHRVLKLKVLDLSFNKIATVKALGQLVANYSSLLALNLTGNPIQANIGNDQLRNAVLSLLPHVTYLNKKAIKPHKVREVATTSIAKAALGDAARSPQRKMTRRLSQGPGSPSKPNFRETNSFRAIKQRSKSGLSTPTRKQAQ